MALRHRFGFGSSSGRIASFLQVPLRICTRGYQTLAGFALHLTTAIADGRIPQTGPGWGGWEMDEGEQNYGRVKGVHH